MAERDESDPVVDRETEAAAREAGAIGGRRPADEPDTPERPLREGGEGEAEGFEQAEEELRARAAHEDPGGDPLADRSDPEPQRSDAEYGEADHERSSETETPDAPD
jgi:hypothetical protein